MNFNQKNTREQLLFGYRNLLYSFVLSFLFFNGFSQSNTNEFNLSPNGVLDNVFDQFGNHYYLENLMVDGNTNESISSKATLLNCSSTSIFNLYFEPGSGMEVVSNPTQNAINAARRAVVCQVFQDVSNFITQPNSPLQPNSQTKVNIWVRDITLLSGVPSNVLGLATSFYCVPYKNDTSNPTFGGITDSEIWKTIHTGEDSYKSFSSPLNPTSLSNDASGAFYHGMIAFKFTNVNWHTNLNDLATSTEHDLYTVALHEIIHALGIATLIGADGNSLLGSGFNYYSRYDKFLKTNDTLQPLISNSNNSCSLYNYSFASSTNAIHPSCPNGNSNSGPSIDTTVCNDAVKFVGSSITIPVYTPTCYELGSSLSHFEDQLFPSCDPDPHYVNNEYFVMSNTTGVGINKRYIKPEERLALSDIGYSAKTSFGLTSTTNGNYNYTGGVLQGITVAGVNDGLDYNASAYIFSGIAGNNIPISILGNDKNVDGFECLKDVYDSSALLNMSLILSGTASTIINFRSSTPGIHLLRYIPINSITGQKGNITYVFVNVIGTYSCTINNICDLVANGNFEQRFSLPTNTGQLRDIITCGWGPGNGGTPDYYRADSLYQPIQVPCNNFGFENDNVNGNIAYAGMNFISSPNGVTTASEPIMTLLRTPILSGGAYQLSFDVSISETAFKSIRFQAYICSNLNPALGSYQSEIPINNTGIFLENTSFSNVSDGWEKVVFNIPASATLGLAPLRYLYIGGLGGPTHVKYQNRTVSNQVAGCNYHSDWGGDNHYYVDNVSLVPTYGGTFSPPSTISCTASSINLTDYLSGLPTDGVFTGSGVTSTFFNPSVAGEGTKTITYTYNSSCSIPLFANINVTPAVVPTFTQVAPICSGTTLAALPTISNNGYEGSWSPGLNNTTTTTYTFTPNDSYCIGKTTMTIIVNPNKTPNFYPIGPICSGDNFALQTTSINNVTGSWSPPINNTTTTTYTFTPSPGQCATSPVLTVIVNPKPQAPIATAQTYCSGATVASLSVTGVAGATFSWYSVANGGTALATSAQLTTTTYYVSQTINGCTSPRKAVAVTINPIPAPPTATAQTYCNGATLTNLVATGITGATFSWYSSATDGIALPVTTLLTTGTYYVSQSLNGCSSTRIPVSLIINNCLPTCTLSLTSANTTSNQTVCLGNLITPIIYATTGNPTNVTVTGLPTGINGVYNNGIFTITGTPTVAGVYNYTVTTVGCATNITATGTITVVTPITVGAITGINSLCVGSTTTYINATAGGSWSSNNSTVAAVNAATGLVTGSSVGSATISYTVSGINGCSDAIITKVITINNCQPPCTISITPANSSNAITTCISKLITVITYAITGNPSSVTITGLPTGLTSNYNNGVLTISGTPTVAGIFNYTITTVGCVTNITATGTINVVTSPTITSINGPTNICITNNTTQLTNATPNGTWSSIYPSIATISANGIINPLSVGTAKFSYTITGQGNCSSSTVYKNIVINVPPLSAGTISTIQGLTITNNTISVCKNDAVTLLSTVPGGSWTSSNSAVASIAPTTGFVYTLNSTTGTTTLTYTVTTGTGIAACSLSTSIQLEVKPLPTVGVIIGATAICLNNPSINYTNSGSGGVWESTNPAVATINSAGLITPVSVGTTTINYTVTGSNNCVAVATKTLTINAAPSTPVLTIYDANNNIIPASQFNSICPGTTFTVTASLLGGTWSSNRPTCASVVVNPTDPTMATITTIAPSPSTYITYTIPASGGCSKVVVSIQVPIIDPLTIIKANPDSAVITNPPGGVIALSSAANTLNTVLFNDVFASATPTTGTGNSTVTLSQVINSTYPAIPGITLNTTTGQIYVANNVPASPVGQPYILRYRICATLPFCAEPVCAEANVSITVGWSPISSAVKANLLSASGICYTATNYTSIESLYYGIKINGVDASPTNAVIIPTFPTTPTGWSLNAGGYIVAPNNALPGNYSFQYKVKPIGSTAYINLTCTFTIGSTLVAYPDIVTFRIGYNGKPYICYAPTESVLENDSVVHCGATTTVATTVPAIAGFGGNVTINIPVQNPPLPFKINPITYEVEVNTGYTNSVDETATYYLTYQICDNAFPNVCETGWVTLSKGTTCSGYALEPQDDFVNLYTNIYNSDQYCMYYVNGYDNVLDNDAIHHYEDNSLEPAVIGTGGNVILNVLDANPPTPSDPFYIDADGAILANPYYQGPSVLNEVHTLNYALADVNFPQNLQMRTVYFYPYSEYCWGSQNKNSSNTKNSILNNVEVNPNPSDGVFTILFKEMVKQDTSLEIFDSRGRKLIKKAVSDVKEYTLNLEGFASGTYILKIVDDTQTVYKKIIIN